MNDPITIGMVSASILAALSFLLKMMINDIKSSIASVGTRMDTALQTYDERITKVEEKHNNDIKQVQSELSNIKGDFATTFVLREDFFRSMNGVEQKMLSMDSKLDKLLMNSGVKSDGCERTGGSTA